MNDYIAKVMPEENYEKYDLQVGETRSDISNSWLRSIDSRYGVEYDNVQKRLAGAGASRSQWFLLNCQTEYRKVLSLPKEACRCWSFSFAVVSSKLSN
jgi:hypothetical protein